MISYLLEKFSVSTETRWTPSAHLSLLTCSNVYLFLCQQVCSISHDDVFTTTNTHKNGGSPCFPLCERTWYLIKVEHCDKTSNWAGFTRVLLTWTNQTSGHSSGVSAAGEFLQWMRVKRHWRNLFQEWNGVWSCVCVIFDQCVFTCTGKWQTPGEGKPWNMTSDHCLR